MFWMDLGKNENQTELINFYLIVKKNWNFVEAKKNMNVFRITSAQWGECNKFNSYSADAFKLVLFMPTYSCQSDRYYNCKIVTLNFT